MENASMYVENVTETFRSYSLGNEEDHMEYIDKDCGGEERDHSMCRAPPCFVLSDRSLVEKINHSQEVGGSKEVIFSTSKVGKDSFLDADAASDSVFFEDMWDTDLSDIEDNDEGDGYFDKLDQINMRSFSFLNPLNLNKSHSTPTTPHQRVSTPRKRKYSSTRGEVGRKLGAMLEKDEDDDIEENYLDTVWTCATQTFYPQCGVVLKTDAEFSSPICPHDNYQLIQEASTMRVPLIGIDHDFNSHHKLHHTTTTTTSSFQPPPPLTFTPPSYLANNATMAPFHYEGRETYRDKLLEGLDQNAAKKSHRTTNGKVTTAPTPADEWKSTQVGTTAHHTSKGFNVMGSSVDGRVDRGDKVDGVRKTVANGKMVVGMVGVVDESQGSESDGGKVGAFQNGVVVSDGGKGKKMTKNSHELKHKKVKATNDEVVKKVTVQFSKEQSPPKKEHTSKKEGLLRLDHNREQPTKQPTKKPPYSSDSEPSHNNYPNHKNNQFTKLKVKIDSTTHPKTASKTQNISHYLNFSSDDEGIFTSPMLSPQSHPPPPTTPALPPAKGKKHKKARKMRGDVYSSDGDSVDASRRRFEGQSPDEAWKRSSSNFDEILWRPALSMGIIIITGIIFYCFKDKIPFMLSSKFPLNKSSI